MIIPMLLVALILAVLFPGAARSLVVLALFGLAFFVIRVLHTN